MRKSYKHNNTGQRDEHRDECVLGLQKSCKHNNAGQCDDAVISFLFGAEKLEKSAGRSSL